MELNFYLVASILALLPGPLLAAVGGTHRALLSVVNGFVMAFVSALVFFELLPQALHEAGPWALMAAVAGFVLPQAFEGWTRPTTEGRGLFAVLLTGLSLHAAADGAALASVAHHGSESLSMAIIVHRLPVGLLIWWMAGGNHRRLLAIASIGALGLATIVGYGWASALSTPNHGGFVLVEAFVAGALLHVLRGPHVHFEPKASSLPLAETAGVALAIVGALWLPADAETTATPVDKFLRLALVSAPALVIGYFVAGLVGTALPPASIRWASRGGPWNQAVRGTALGLPIPICSCGVVPLYAGLHKAGLPASAGLAFLVATPELGIESFLLSYPLLGPQMTLARLGAAALLAIIVGALVGRAAAHNSEPNAQPTTATMPSAVTAPSLGARLRQILHIGFSELLETTGPWIVAGLAIAALFEPRMLAEVAGAAPGPVTVLLFALIGVPLYVCASGATPLAAALVVSGVSPGAALAFLLAGPATNVTTFGLLKHLHGPRIAVLFGIAAIGGAVSLGLTLDVLWNPSWHPPRLDQTVDNIGVLHWACLAILILASLRLFILKGPVALVQNLFNDQPLSSIRSDTRSGCGAQSTGQAENEQTCCS